MTNQPLWPQFAEGLTGRQRALFEEGGISAIEAEQRAEDEAKRARLAADESLTFEFAKEPQERPEA